MNLLLEYTMNRPAPAIVSTTGVSAAGAVVSFAEDTLPVLQWFGAAIAVISGILGIMIALYHLKQIWNKEFRDS